MTAHLKLCPHISIFQRNSRALQDRDKSPRNGASASSTGLSFLSESPNLLPLDITAKASISR